MTYNNHDSIYKVIHRVELIKDLIELGTKEPKVLSLPSTNFYFEEQLLDRIPNIQINCVEFHPEIYNNVIKSKRYKEVNKKGFITYKSCDILDHLSFNPQHYDLIWLDLCCTISPELLYKLISIFQYSLKKNSIIALTLSCSRESNIDNLRKFYKCESNEIFRFKKLPQLLIDFGKIKNNNIELLRTERYRSELNNHSTPMVMFTFKNN